MNRYVLPVLALVLAIIAATFAHAPTRAYMPALQTDEPVTPTPPPPGTAEANKVLVRSYLEQVLMLGRLEAFDEFVSPTYKRYLSATAAPLPPEGNKQRLAGLRAAFPDMQVWIEDLFAQDDYVAYRLTARGTHQGVFQGIPPTGKPMIVTAVEIVRIKNGKLVEHWGGPDTLSMLQQLGAVVSAGPAGQ